VHRFKRTHTIFTFSEKPNEDEGGCHQDLSYPPVPF
jgi:hypothetical protein